MNSKWIVLSLSIASFSAFAAPSSKIKARSAASTPTVTESSSTTTSSIKMPGPSAYDVAPKGVRISVFKPVLTMKVKDQDRNQNERTLDNTFGFSFGYANLPYKEIGWTANGTYIEIFEAGEKYGVIRTDANIGYGFEKNLNVKAGLNLSKFVIPARMRDDYNPNIGVQASAGLQMTKNVGLDAGYTYMKQTNSNEEVLLSGLEIGLHGTF
ncbi:hypothetical protein AZI86_09950 [Bdellovibrio bacteriovorus]|uniref:Outer membrane protein beta-barrel domain-containing protein n=1 Tax=Bdellovibrio bacteriovorus TaxID=959 RepID=A0A150WS97_BDEBC|nr:hypothetical protein [Bdellovibrio bacteriovorus]KYG67310.1 hypothetical protein AZI86_09950 [Bdellovibrio bacteriovorus]